MKVLIACEESQTVCKAFRARGHEAYSCDIQEPSGGKPEWHILGDALEAIKGGLIITMDGQVHDVGKWDLLIAHPPCTKTSNAGARWLYRGGQLDIGRYYQGLCGKAFFLALWAAPIDRVVIENPRPSKIFEFPECTQVVQPFEYGDPFSKKTLLWEFGINPLVPTNILSEYKPIVSCGTSRNKGNRDKAGISRKGGASKARSKFSPGIAKAMAEQWG